MANKFSINTFIDKSGNWTSTDGLLYSIPKSSSAEFEITQGKEGVLRQVPIVGDIIKSFPKSPLAITARGVVESLEKKSLTPLKESGQQILQDINKSSAEFRKLPVEEQAKRMVESFGGVGITGAIKKTAGDIVKKAGKETLEELGGKITKEGGFKVASDKFLTSVKSKFPEVKVAGQHIVRDTDKLAVKARNLVLDNIDEAEKIARTRMDDEGVATASELIKHYGNLASSAKDKATQNIFYDKMADIAHPAAKNLVEAGRSVQAASILGRLTPEGQVRFAAREIVRYNEAVTKGLAGRTRGLFGVQKQVPNLTGQQADEIVTRMKTIEAMPDGTQKAMEFQKLQDYTHSLIPSSLMDKIVSVWKAGLLTGVKTSGLNIFSNVSHGALEVVKDVPAVAVDKVASLFTGKRTIALTGKGTAKGAQEGFQKGWQYFKTGFDERNIATKLDYKKVNFGTSKIARGLQKYEETVFRTIGAEDQPFFYGAKARSLTSQAIAEAKNQGIKGGEAIKEFVEKLVQNPTDDMLGYAVSDAEISVFQNKTVLSNIGRLIQKIPFVGQLLVPFSRTPSAVATQVIKYSPVGFLTTVAENVGKGRFNQRQFSQGIGRAVVGSGIVYGGVELFKKGLISLDRPTTEREQELWKAEGRTPNSVKIDGKWRSGQVLGPIWNLVLLGGHYARAIEKKGSSAEAMSEALAGTAKSFTEQTFLRGINQALEAIMDPARSASSTIGTYLSSTIPTLVKDIATAKDELERRPESILDKFKVRIPGVRETVEPQVDVLGREVKRGGNIIETIADPSRPSKDVSTPLTEEIRRLYEGGYVKAAPTKLGDKKGYEVLIKEQNTDLWQRAGEITESKLNSLISNPLYSKLDDEQKEKKISDFVEKSKLVARAEKVLELTQGLKGQDLLNKLSELKKGKLMSKEVYERFLQLR